MQAAYHDDGGCVGDAADLPPLAADIVAHIEDMRDSVAAMRDLLANIDARLEQQAERVEQSPRNYDMSHRADWANHCLHMSARRALITEMARSIGAKL